MAMTITLADDLLAGLEYRAKQQQLSVEQVAISILTEAVAAAASVSPREVVAHIRATAPNPSQVRAATANLADVLRATPGDPGFNLENWQRQWSIVEAELKAVTRANGVAESHVG